MKVGIITFHGAHNYGSVLQAYALQQVCLGLGHECEIINFRTDTQKELYNVFARRKKMKYILRNIYFMFTYSSRKAKFDKFERFIAEKLDLSEKEFRSSKELVSLADSYDCFISGSDQIWNIEVNDFDPAYFLPFTQQKKVAYAPSCGSRNRFSPESKRRFIPHLEQYSSIAVRDLGTQAFVEELTGRVPKVVLDPTFLLRRRQWDELASDSMNDYDEYIFMYTLSASRQLVDTAKQLSRIYKLPVVVSNITNQHDVLAGFKKYADSGPCDFLTLIKNAKCVLTTSYHATIFSLIYNKPFYAFNGMKDERISYLLSVLGLEDRSISVDTVKKVANVATIDWDKVDSILEEEITASLSFLKESLRD